LCLNLAGMSHFLVKPGGREDVRVGGDQRCGCAWFHAGVLVVPAGS